MTLRRLTILAVSIAVLGYLGFHIRGLLAAPPLTLLSPPQGLTTSNNVIVIKGKTLPGVTLAINGEKLPLLTSGNFEHTVVLSGGLNTLIVSARSRYSRPAVIKRQVFILEGERLSKGAGGGI